MADVEHSSLTDPNLHEPKGVAAASAGEVYVADGSASGAWTPREYTLSVVIDDVSTADTNYIPVPYSGTVVKVQSVLEGALTGADATITVNNSAASSMGTLTITQAGSAAGDVDTLVPASNNTVTNDDYITIATDGGSTGTQRLWLTIVIERDS